jgi:pyruvate dehydrogenase E2 component (dihydrolipoamide acetyltransferase)
MTEGTSRWLAEEGARVEPGMEVCDVETERSPTPSSRCYRPLRRKAAQEGDVVSVSALGVVADATVPDAEIEAYIKEFQATWCRRHPRRKRRTVAAKDRSRGPIRALPGRGEGGTPVILIHGFGGDLNNYCSITSRCPETRSLCADLPGHGESSKQPNAAMSASLRKSLRHSWLRSRFRRRISSDIP